MATTVSLSLAEVGCYMVNGSAMLPPALGTYGNMQRNGLRARVSVLGMLRYKGLEDQRTVQRAVPGGGFNILQPHDVRWRWAHLAAPNTFGEATSTPDVAQIQPDRRQWRSREVQLGLKLSF